MKMVVHLVSCAATPILLASWLAACGGQSAAPRENTVEACRDGRDNDADRFVDCDDQDCLLFCSVPDGGADGDADGDADTDSDGDGDGDSDGDADGDGDGDGDADGDGDLDCGQPTEWTVDTLDDAHRTGYEPSIALDESGHVHITYADASTTRLQYGTDASGVWVAEDVDTEQATFHSAIAIGDDGVPQVVYGLRGNGDVNQLWYAVRGDGGWVAELVDGDRAGAYLDLALDDSGAAHVVYVALGGGLENVLRYATNAAGAWQVEDITDFVPTTTAFALDADGHAHVVAYVNSAAVWYYTNASGVWEPTVLSPAARRGVSLAIDSQGTIHAAWAEATMELGYAENDGNGWVTDSLWQDVFEVTDMIVAADGSVRVAYTESAFDVNGNLAAGRLFLASNVGGVWDHEVVDADEGMNAAALARTARGHIYAAYDALAEEDLRLAERCE